MKRILSIIILLICISLTFFCTGCKDYSNYMNEPGYEEYISDCDTGEIAPFFEMDEAMYNDTAVGEKAREFYRNNKRRVGNYQITNYMEGVCINRIYRPIDFDGEIPETLDGLPVVKLGCYIDKNGNLMPFLPIDYNYYVKLPSTLKYISYRCCSNDWIMDVVENNPYYEVEYDLNKGDGVADCLFVIVEGEKIFVETDRMTLNADIGY